MPKYEISRAGKKLGEVTAADEKEAAKKAAIKYGPPQETSTDIEAERALGINERHRNKNGLRSD